jgi:hypothetical protein
LLDGEGLCSATDFEALSESIERHHDEGDEENVFHGFSPVKVKGDPS